MLAKSDAVDLREHLHAEMLACIPVLTSYAVKLTRDVDAGRDLVHDALLRGMAALHCFEPGTNMQAWLFTIMKHHFLGSRRRKRETARLPGADNLLSFSFDAQRAADAKNELRVLMGHLARMPPDFQEIIELMCFHGMKQREVAKHLGIPIGTVKSRLCRARAMLFGAMGIDRRGAHARRV